MADTVNCMLRLYILPQSKQMIRPRASVVLRLSNPECSKEVLEWAGRFGNQCRSETTPDREPEASAGSGRPASRRGQVSGCFLPRGWLAKPERHSSAAPKPCGKDCSMDQQCRDVGMARIQKKNRRGTDIALSAPSRVNLTRNSIKMFTKDGLLPPPSFMRQSAA